MEVSKYVLVNFIKLAVLPVSELLKIKYTLTNSTGQRGLVDEKLSLVRELLLLVIDDRTSATYPSEL